MTVALPNKAGYRPRVPDETPSKNAVAHVVDRVLALGMFVELDRLFTALFGIPADALTERRLKRLARIHELRTQKAALLGATEPKTLPEKVAQEVLTGAAVEEDEDMQDLWANLLANHDGGANITTFLTGFLKSLDGRSAKVLLFYWEKTQAIQAELAACTSHEQAMAVHQKSCACDADLAHLGPWAKDERIRLTSLGLIAHIMTPTTTVYFALEEAGYLLCRAITAPKAPVPAPSP